MSEDVYSCVEKKVRKCCGHGEEGRDCEISYYFNTKSDENVQEIPGGVGRVILSING